MELVVESTIHKLLSLTYRPRTFAVKLSNPTVWDLFWILNRLYVLISFMMPQLITGHLWFMWNNESKLRRLLIQVDFVTYFKSIGNYIFHNTGTTYAWISPYIRKFLPHKLLYNVEAGIKDGGWEWSQQSGSFFRFWWPAINRWRHIYEIVIRKTVQYLLFLEFLGVVV